jgi:lipopolysaccharide assembly outer membrane protein LptD (OstA)
MSSRLLVSIIVAGLFGLALLHYSGVVHAQETSQKHILAAPLNAHNGARLSALQIERGPSYPSVIHLTGNVEIKSSGFILQASAADYDEDTGEIRARGEVTVKPYPASQQNTPEQ